MDAKKKMNKIRDDLDYSYGLFKDISSSLGRVTSVERLRSSISSGIDWTEIREYDAYDDEITEKRQRLLMNFLN